MTCSTLPDVNVWVALTLDTHVHHRYAWDWYQKLPVEEQPAFCRVTQLGFLRLLTVRGVAPQTHTQREAWIIYDRWQNGGGATYLEEPFGTELDFRAFADRSTPSPKEWTDSYLAGFAAARSLTLVTFDRALSSRARRSILLG